MIRRPSSIRLVCLPLLACTLSALAQTQPAATAPAKFRIVLAGDSTVATGNGWGPGFAKQLADDTESLDLAANGRSSKSFLLEGLWKKCLAAKPDVDADPSSATTTNPPKAPTAETDPKTTYTDYMSIYVDEARAMSGAKPILVHLARSPPMGRRRQNSLHPHALGRCRDPARENQGRPGNRPARSVDRSVRKTRQRCRQRTLRQNRHRRRRQHPPERQRQRRHRPSSSPPNSRKPSPISPPT